MHVKIWDCLMLTKDENAVPQSIAGHINKDLRVKDCWNSSILIWNIFPTTFHGG